MIEIDIWSGIDLTAEIVGQTSQTDACRGRRGMGKKAAKSKTTKAAAPAAAAPAEKPRSGPQRTPQNPLLEMLMWARINREKRSA